MTFMKIPPPQNKELVAPLSTSKQFVNNVASEMRLSRHICSVFDADPTFSFFQLECQYTELAC